MPDGVHQPRQYSLTRADDGEHRQFSVKRVHGGGEPDGEVSTLLHDTVGIGDVLTLSLPYGDVVLDDSGRPVVFASAGMGIAPMAGMLSHLVAAGSRAADHPAARRPRRGLVRPAPAGRHRRARAAPTRRCTSGTRSRRDSNEPVDGVHDGHDGPRRRSTCPTTPPTTCAARCRSCRRCAARCSSAGSPRGTSSTRCSARTCGRPTSTDIGHVGTSSASAICPRLFRRFVRGRQCSHPRSGRMCWRSPDLVGVRTPATRAAGSAAPRSRWTERPPFVVATRAPRVFDSRQAAGLTEPASSAVGLTRRVDQ